MATFVDYILQPNHVLTMLAVWALITTVQRLVPALSHNAIWVRLLPLMPVVLCSAVVWLPGLVEGAPAEKALLGFVLGMMCGHAHKMLKQTLFGKDARIPGA